LYDTKFASSNSKIRLIKEQKAEKFRSISYNSLDQLIDTVKEDTKNFEQIAARGYVF